jgi:hypothetical protein
MDRALRCPSIRAFHGVQRKESTMATRIKRATSIAPAADIRGTAPPLVTGTAGDKRGKKVDRQALYLAVIHGLQTYYEPSDIFRMEAGTFTRDQLIDEFQKFVSAAQLTKNSNQKWRADIQAERVIEERVRALRHGVQGITQARFGPQGAPNLQFGFALPKPRRRSAETAAIAVKRSLATRQKRGTMGYKEKQKIKGDVHVAVVVTPAGGATPDTPSGAPGVVAPVAAPTPVGPVMPPAAPASVANGAGTGGAVPAHDK